MVIQEAAIDEMISDSDDFGFDFDFTLSSL